MIRVFVLAPTPMMQAGLQSMLASSDIRVLDVAADLALPDISASLLDIDVMVVADDAQLEDVGRLVTNTHRIALVVLGQESERIPSILRSMDLAGWALVPPDAAAEQLQAAVLAVSQGFALLPLSLANQRLEQRASAVATLTLEDITDDSLTPREREVLELVGQGLPNKLIARQLHISEHTVKFHVSSISTKLGASGRTDAVRRGLRRGLITL